MVPEVRQILRVFLASPNDLAAERKVAKRVVDEINELYGSVFGYHVELVGWEDTVSVFGRPQAIINNELSKCEYFVGMLWRRWGTPPDTAGLYTSGFEEEFELSVKRRESDGSPEISLFFREVPPEVTSDAGPELSKVIAFKSKLVEEKKILFEVFAETSDFEAKFRRCISRHLTNRREKERDQTAEAGGKPTTGGESSPPTEGGNSWVSPLSAEGAAFLRYFVASTESESANKTLTATDVARFRLLDSIVGRQGNDEQSLGPHDANLLFAARRHFEFGSYEIDGLVGTGLASYAEENVPIWYWLSRANLDRGSLLTIYAYLGAMPARRAGALAVMTLIREPIPEDFFLGRVECLKGWLSEQTPRPVKKAALLYLSACGIEADVDVLSEELAKNDSQTRSASADAILAIKLRHNPEAALQTLQDLQVSGLEKNIVTSVFRKSKISDVDLLKLVAHPDSSVRLSAVLQLSLRNELPKEIADNLTKDSDAKIRYQALVLLAKLGGAPTYRDAKRILSRSSTPRFGGFGMFTFPDKEEEHLLERYKVSQLAKLTFEELEAKATIELPLEIDAYLEMVRRDFRRYAPEIRGAIDDMFEAKFNEWLEKLSSVSQSDAVEKIKAMETNLRKEFTQESLELIYQEGDATDLPRVRRCLENGDSQYSDGLAAYLSKFGEWSDIHRIISSLAERSQLGNSLLLGNSESYQAAAACIYAIGSDRLAELIALAMPARLLCSIVIVVRDIDFGRLDDSGVTSLLSHQDIELRKVVALKCLRAFARRRIELLLAQQLRGSRRYYNVVHWLDMGASLKVTDRRRAAQRALESITQKSS